ncbi:unnamed protein product [Rhodiola kirilowii]
MKRFFKPIEKEGSAKKPSLSPAPVAAGCDSDGVENGGLESGEKRKEPLKFVTWNANSLLLRVKNNWPEVCKFVSEFDPDVIAIQEVRMPSAGSKGGPKNPGDVKDDTSAARDEKRVLMRALSSPPFRDFEVWWSLSESKGVFKPKKVSFSLDLTSSKHEPDGRVILAEFETFRLLNTYVPNNGWKEEENSFQRRRKWDKRILEFVLQSSDKNLIWCGDLNVSHEEIDVSHPEFFSTAKLNGYIPPSKEDVGQPGFTLAERKRFGSILKEGKLIDAYRFMHKDKDMEQGFSWSGNPIGKYRGKQLEGFYGSDHCPVSLELSPPEHIEHQIVNDQQTGSKSESEQAREVS